MAEGRDDSKPAVHIRLDPGHAWRPPFGLDRIGRPIGVVVEIDGQPPAGSYLVVASLRGKEVGRKTLTFPVNPPFVSLATLDQVTTADLLSVLMTTGEAMKPTEAARLPISLADLEADAAVVASPAINPVDLGTILVPADTLALGPGQAAKLDVALISRVPDRTQVRVKSWFRSDPARTAATTQAIAPNRRAHWANLPIAELPSAGDRDTLSVAVEDAAGIVLWRKEIAVMFFRDPPHHPRFGATYERLRYDSPISIREPGTGKFSSMRYEDGWSPELRDVVVWLPGGGRFVFWRGSSFIPFWAGLHNTGACYEWAEVISQPQGAVDCVEPLMDKELRYSRVEILESTPARVHVRWSYQSTDFHYKVWGDRAVEDYYFYPDGMGTRVVNLDADPKNDYELSEFIILSPQGAYPFDVLPDNPVDALYLNGAKHHFRFPNAPEPDASRNAHDRDNVAAIYRLRFGKAEKLAAIYFNPGETQLPRVIFGPFYDGGQMVTPCYWGSHWPLARGNSTGNAIDDRIRFTPTHNSVMSWAGKRPTPLATAERVVLDALGRSRLMTRRTWAWLIGATDADDARLVAWAKSFAAPPSLELKGARLAFDSYCPERRAIGLEVLSSDVRIMIKPGAPCVNPVFELTGVAAGVRPRVSIGGRLLEGEQVAWDGRTLWIDANVAAPSELHLIFDAP
jgi:hypothetical protein